MKVTITCRVCGALRQRSPSAARTDNLFCSKRCNARFHAEKRKNKAAEQFWSRVTIRQPEECWFWTGYKNPAGYGQIGWNGKLRLTHRIALSLTDGDFVSQLRVCHSCDNPSCCNPAHLWRGTDHDNVHDRISKGRSNFARGEAASKTKLTTESVLAIRASKGVASIFANKFGVSVPTIHAIRTRRTWRHLP